MRAPAEHRGCARKATARCTCRQRRCHLAHSVVTARAQSDLGIAHGADAIAERCGDHRGADPARQTLQRAPLRRSPRATRRRRTSSASRDAHPPTPERQRPGRSPRSSPPLDDSDRLGRASSGGTSAPARAFALGVNNPAANARSTRAAASAMKLCANAAATLSTAKSIIEPMRRRRRSRRAVSVVRMGELVAYASAKIDTRRPACATAIGWQIRCDRRQQRSDHEALGPDRERAEREPVERSQAPQASGATSMGIATFESESIIDALLSK